MKNFLILFCISLFSKIFAQPVFEFSKYEQDRQPEIEMAMYKFHIEPDLEQMRVALKDIMKFETKLHYVYSFIRKFPNACTKEMFQQLTSKWESDMKMEEIIPYEDTDEWYYKFLCLDFNGDKLVDVILMPEVFFGPTYGLVCYAKVNGKFIRIFDKAGHIVKFEKRGKEIIFQYEIITIEDAETNVLETLMYDLKKSQFSHNSKLYYATDTRLPEKIKNSGQFEIKTDVPVRADTIVNDEKFPEDWFYEAGRGTQKLRGNVVAEYPVGAKGYLLAEEKGFAFVAFLPDSKFKECSLRHGMEYSGDGDDYKPDPKPYICGWIEKRALKKLKRAK